MGFRTIPVREVCLHIYLIFHIQMNPRFGSEMAWDSTGQEGVYAWSKYLNDTKTATNTINSIIAYQPTIPHWGYNGNARRYW